MFPAEERNAAPNPAVVAVPVLRANGSGFDACADALAVEEPLEIRVGFDGSGRRGHRGVSITMRTPGHDHELAVGFLFTDGLIADRGQVAAVRACGGGNVVRVD